MGNFVDSLTGRDAEKDAKKQSQFARGRGLSELEPEKIMELIKLFQTQMYQSQSSQIGGAQGAIRGIGGRIGAQGSGVLKQLQAGVPGQLANSALMSAIPLGSSIAKSRADIASGKDPATRSRLGAAIDTGRQGATAYATGGLVK